MKVLTERILFSLLIICISSISCFSAVRDTVYFDSVPFIKIHEKNISIRPFFQQRFALIDISKTDQTKAPEINYASSPRTSIGLSGGYKGYTLGLSIQMPNDQSTIDKYGSTDYTDMQASLFTRTIGADVYYQSYKGFYLRNPTDFDTVWTDSSSFPQLNNFKLRSLGFNFFYINKKKFSFRAAFGHTERQLKSSGSFLMMFSLRNSKIFTPGSIIPDSVAFAFPKIDSLRESESTLISLSPGFGMTLVHNELFFSMAGFLGIGGQFQNFTFIDNNSVSIQPSLKFNIRGAFGFNGDKQYIGILYGIDTQSIVLDKATMNIAMYSIRFAFGFRI